MSIRISAKKQRLGNVCWHLNPSSKADLHPTWSDLRYCWKLRIPPLHFDSWTSWAVWDARCTPPHCARRGLCCLWCVRLQCCSSSPSLPPLFPNRIICKGGKKINKSISRWTAKEKKRQEWKKSVSPLTQDEVVLRQLCVSDLFVQSAAGVDIHVGHEAAVVKFLLDLSH